MSDRLNEALSVSEPISEEDELIFAAARAYADLVNGERVEPDYEAALKPLDKFLHDDPWFPHERYAECRDIEGELVAEIVQAAIGDRLLIDPT